MQNFVRRFLESIMSDKLPIPVMKPFAFRVKGYRSDGMDRHGVWEIIGCDGMGGEDEKLKIRRIATARTDCPLNEVWEVWSVCVRDEAERVEWSTFLPSERGI
jgi:hypothetical protein